MRTSLVLIVIALAISIVSSFGMRSSSLQSLFFRRVLCRPSSSTSSPCFLPGYHRPSSSCTLFGAALGDVGSAKRALHDSAAAKQLSQQPIKAGGSIPSVRFGQEGSCCGDYNVISSETRGLRTYTDVKDIALCPPNSPPIWLRGRLHSIRIKGKSCFLVLRQNAFDTVQCCLFKDDGSSSSALLLSYLKTLSPETLIDVQGLPLLSPAPVTGCSVSSHELRLASVHAVSRPTVPALPFSIDDASRPDAEVEASQSSDRPFPRLGQELRLDNRHLDVRAPPQNAILRVQSGVCQLFREAMLARGFTEIHTPKLCGGSSEGGSGVFEIKDYFGQKACLAQSPQLYKQMAIAADLQRVFEIGPVFRAENSNTRRHLCEFTGLDIEMEIKEHYMETLEVVHDMFKHIFNGLEERYATELKVIRKQFPSETVQFTDKPCVLHWPEAMDILSAAGFDVGDRMTDLTTAQELALGSKVKELYKTDFFILDRYPATIRPFYTMLAPDDERYSNSYDMFIRGQEICSGAQRCHDYEALLLNLERKGLTPDGGMKAYLDSFKHGISPHAGAGIGLERVVFLYLGLDNVRKACMFPRDPNRLSP